MPAGPTLRIALVRAARFTVHALVVWLAAFPPLPPWRSLLMTGALAGGLLAGAASGVRAQSYGDYFDNPYVGQPRSLSLEAFGGTYWSSPWNDLVLLGALSSRNAVEQVLLRQVQVHPAALYGGSVTYRRGRGGFRVQAAYSRSCLEMAGSCDPAQQGSQTQVPLPGHIDVNTWMADVDAEVSLVPIHGGEWIRPYVLLGAGGVVYDPRGNAAQLLPQFLQFPGGTATTTGNEVTVSFPGSGTVVADVHGAGLQTVFAGVLGLGTDVRVPVGNGGFGIRVQVADHIAASPMKVAVLQAGNVQPASFDFGSIQNIRLTAGVVLDFDLGRVKPKRASSDD